MSHIMMCLQLNSDYLKVAKIVSVGPTISTTGQVYLYLGNDIDNCMVVNIDPAGINFRSRINGEEFVLWRINK